MGYTSKAVAGFTGQTALKLSSNVITLIKVAIIARILAPTDFGLFSLVTIALGLTEAFTETGVNTTIIQSKKPVSYFVDTAWVIAIIRGLLIGGAMFLVGWAMKYYYNQSMLVSLVAVAALVPVIKGFINPGIIGIYKDLNFKADTAYKFALATIESIAIVVLVFLFHSVYAWILGLVISALAEVIISFVFFKLRPNFKYLKGPAQAIFSQTKVLSLNSFLSYLIENVDNLIIGKTVGEFGLGIYQPTYGLAHEPNYEIAKSVHYGTLPVYTRITDEHQRLRKAFFKSCLVTLGIATLLSLPLIIFPELIIHIILGDKWTQAIDIIRWLTLAGWLQAVAMVCYTLLLARKKVHLMNWHMGINFVLLVIFVYWGGVHGGLTGAVLGVVASRIIALPIIGFAVIHELK